MQVTSDPSHHIEGYEVQTASTAAEGLRLTRHGAFDLIVLDNWFAEENVFAMIFLWIKDKTNYALLQFKR